MEFEGEDIEKGVEGGGFAKQLIIHGGPIHIDNLVSSHFQHLLLNELQKLKDELSSLSVSDEYDCDEDVSVDELKVFRDEELVSMALKEVFRNELETGSSLNCGEEQQQNAAEGREDACDGTSSYLPPASSDPSKERDSEASNERVILESNSKKRKSGKECAIASKSNNSSNKSKRKKVNKAAIATTGKNTSMQPRRTRGIQVDDDQSYLVKVDEFLRSEM